jgi:chromosome segregation ATPase
MAVTNSDVKKLADTISTLQQDMAQVGTLVDRLDVTIEKLTEVSTRVSELLAVQGTRLEAQEKASEQLQELIEKRRVETDTNIKDVYVRVERVEKDLYDEIEASQEKVLKEIKEMRAESTTQHNELKGKVNRLEKWMWTIIGGLAVITLIIQIGTRFIPA